MWSFAERILENYSGFSTKQLAHIASLFASMSARHYGLFNVIALAIQDSFAPDLYVWTMKIGFFAEVSDDNMKK